ncbi:uncharacterized protein LOC114022586 [Chelonia mydas]|uniref:uncharacterized protein LOC114022586 n=1 Tax=Chelonia mydas TaxID=8469 RepID=UPI0018A2223E|nr:uncharacterized protein LOC114022586 [Chelonia mydas]
MLVIVSTLVSLLHPVLSALSGAVQWRGLEHWFFLLGLRLLAMYFASAPWESAQQDIACAWSTSQDEETRHFCTSVCYNRHFLDPVLPTWGFSFLIALLPITIIRMLYPKKDPHGKGGQEVAASATCNRATEHTLVESSRAARPELVGQSNMATKSNVAAMARLMGDSNMATNPRLVGATNVAARANTVGVSGVTGSPAGPDMAAQPAWCASVITVCIAVLLATEVGFLWALLARQLPMVSGSSFPCFPGLLACPSVLECAVRGQADKHMALVILALTACFSILVCLTYGGVWVALATCCRGRQEGERALEGEHLRCCEGWEERGMGEGRMLIIVSTLVSLLHPVLSAMSGALRWQGLEHWFFLLGLRLLALYFASAPWESARDDLACAWSRSQEEESRRFCTLVCYNRHFLDPVMPTWGFSFLIALLPITIMRMMYPQEDSQGPGREEDTASTRPNMAAGRRFDGQSNLATKPKLAGEANTAAKSNMAAEPRPVGDSNMAAPPKLVDTTNTAAGDNTVGLSGVTGPPAGPNMAAQPPWHAGVFTVCLAVLLATEASFLWALLARQLPMVSGPTFPCFPGTPACPPALECTIWGQADKRMALGSLALTACVSILNI